MEEKSILSVDLYENLLTEKAGDYSGKVQITGTLHNSDVAQRFVKGRTEYRPETIENILNITDQIKVEMVAEGKSLVDGLGQYLLNIKGAFEGEDPKFDPQKHTLGVTYTPGRLLLKALKLISVNPRIAKTGPVINSITDSTTGSKNGIITSSGPAVIDGSTLLLKGDDPTVGVYFTPDGGGEAKKVQIVVMNTKSQIIISIPQLTAGQYSLSIKTQAGANYQLVKEARTYVFPILLTVEDEGGSGGGEDDRPVIE